MEKGSRPFTVPMRGRSGTPSDSIEEGSRTLTFPMEEGSEILTVPTEEYLLQILSYNIVMSLQQLLSLFRG